MRGRWRLRGAWQWPTFAFSLVGETVLLHRAPIAGDSTGVAGAFLATLGLNLVVLAVLAPGGAVLLRRRRGDLPRVVARDRCGTGGMLALACLLVALAVHHHPTILAGKRAFAAQSASVRRYVRLHAAAEYQARIDAADTWRMEPNLYRTCVPGADPQRALCLIVDTAVMPPGVTVDPDRAPNTTYVGPRP